MLFYDFLIELGILPPKNLVPERWMRTGTVTHPTKKNAAVKLCDNGRIGFAQDFASMVETAIWRIDDDTKITKKERTAAENAALSEKLTKKREEEIQGIMRARAAYANAMPLLNADHEYLRRKNLDMLGCRGLKVDAQGWLIVPMNRDGRLTSIQRISPEGEKKFAYACPSKWTSYRLNRPAATVTILCEGLATGLTILSAIPQAQVEVCFSAANMIAVAERNEWIGMMGIAGDNDFDTEETHGRNPGREAAQRAAEIIGCGYALPIGDSGTDFNDLYCARLEMLQKASDKSTRPVHPQSLRRSALSPIKDLVMRSCKFVSMPKKYAQPVK